MSREGPEQLCKVPLTVRDLLEMIGQDTEENLAIVDDLCRLSIATFDIESRTVATDMQQSDDVLQQSHVEANGANMPYHVFGIQKPCMVAHWDALCELKHFPPEIQVAQSDDEAAIYTMFEKYWAAVEQRVKVLRELKLKKPNQYLTFFKSIALLMSVLCKNGVLSKMK